MQGVGMEVELKAYAEDLEAVELRLKRLGAKKTFQGVQVAEYYAPPGRKCEEKGFVLRVRVEGSKSFLTLKKSTATPGAWIEHETPVGNADETRQILSEAGFQKFLSVNKTRSEYALDGVSYCLDDVQGLGRFVEVEKFGDEAVKIQLELKEKLNALGLTDITQKGYVKLMLEKHACSGTLSGLKV